MNIAFPYHLDHRGRTAIADDERHIRDLIEQVLLTTPGERVNRPDFGSGLRQLLFSPSSPELAAAAQLVIQGALQQWLGELVEVLAVEVEVEDEGGRICVLIRYKVRRTQQERVAEVFSEV